MSAGAVLVLVCLVGAAAVAFVSSLGVLVMRDPFQRLHFIAPPATLSAVLVIVAVGLGARSTQATLKTAAVALLLLVINGVVTHATARAVRLRGTEPASGGRPREQPS